jgi:hypothetical protein
MYKDPGYGLPGGPRILEGLWPKSCKFSAASPGVAPPA